MSWALERLDADVDNASIMTDVFTHQPFGLWSCVLVLSFLGKSQSVQWSYLSAGLFAKELPHPPPFPPVTRRTRHAIKYNTRVT